jgi:hypothetical protein
MRHPSIAGEGGKRKDGRVSDLLEWLMATYDFDLAKDEGHQVRNYHNGAPYYESDRGPDVELGRPQGQVVIGREMGVIVYHERVRCRSEDGDPGEERQGREAETKAVEETDPALLSLEDHIARINLELRSRHRALVSERHYKCRHVGNDGWLIGSVNRPNKRTGPACLSNFVGSWAI